MIVFAPPGQFLVLSLKEVNRSWCCCTLPSISWSFAMLTEQIQTKRPWVQFTETCISEREHQCKWCWCSSPNKLFYLYSCRDPNIDVIFMHRLFSFCFYYNCCCQACCDTHTHRRLAFPWTCGNNLASDNITSCDVTENDKHEFHQRSIRRMFPQLLDGSHWWLWWLWLPLCSIIVIKCFQNM